MDKEEGKQASSHQMKEVISCGSTTKRKGKEGGATRLRPGSSDGKEARLIPSYRSEDQRGDQRQVAAVIFFFV